MDSLAELPSPSLSPRIRTVFLPKPVQAFWSSFSGQRFARFLVKTSGLPHARFLDKFYGQGFWLWVAARARFPAEASGLVRARFVGRVSGICRWLAPCKVSGRCRWLTPCKVCSQGFLCTKFQEIRSPIMNQLKYWWCAATKVKLCRL